MQELFFVTILFITFYISLIFLIYIFVVPTIGFCFLCNKLNLLNNFFKLFYLILPAIDQEGKTGLNVFKGLYSTQVQLYLIKTVDPKYPKCYDKSRK